jgi:inorganic pyrophosphatase
MSRKKTSIAHLDDLPTYDRQSECLNAVIETPKGSRAKLAYEPRFNALLVKRVLPEGLSFPFDFGFVPSTLEADGDPMDVLVLLDAAVPCPCVVRSRLIGVIEARESNDDGKMVENVRLVAIGERSRLFADVSRISDLPKHVLDEVEHFFISYNQQDGKTFEVVACRGPKTAKRLIEKAQRRRTRRRG